MAARQVYEGQILLVVEKCIRELQSIRGAQRELAKLTKSDAQAIGEDNWPWGENGPAIKTLRQIHRAMSPPVELNNSGGAPKTYTKEQRLEMARLGKLYGVTGETGAMAILAASNRRHLSRLRDKTIFPQPKNVSQPTITDAMQSN